QRDHVELLNGLAGLMSPGGVIYFSTNFKRFKFDQSAIGGCTPREISKQTIPEDFRNKRIHRAWRIEVAG
ncbi:MAG: SAM-dependent methyltransferase, partial [bacterium]|nr:SAM-dependent methyltransferase [bacterium]